MNQVAAAFLTVLTILFVILALMFGLPLWNVWKQGLSGEANLARAEQEKQIMIETAKAEKEAAQYTADAIGIIGKAAQQYPEYRQQEFIKAFGEALNKETINQIIYVPTEANIPLTEAGKR